MEAAHADLDRDPDDECCWLIQERSDPLGERAMTFAENGARLETLRLRDDLASRPGFADALRAAARRRSPAIAPVRVTDTHPDRSLIVRSEIPEGIRLSELVGAIAAGEIRGEPTVAIVIGIAILSALRSLSRECPPIFHGAVTAERIVMTASGHAVFLDGAVGEALRAVESPRDAIWRDLRIARPPGAGGRIGAAGDVLQAAIVILEMLIGRQLGDEDFPDQLETIVQQAVGFDGGQPLGSWFRRALYLTDPPGFTTAGAALDAFVQATDSKAIDSRRTTIRSLFDGAFGAISSDADPDEAAAQPIDDASAERVEAFAAPFPANTRLRAAILLLTLTAGGFGALAISRLARPPAPRVQTGRLSVVSTPPADVSIDGRPLGRTPVTLPVNAGPHTIHLQHESAMRDVTVAVAAGSDTTHYVEMPSLLPGDRRPATMDPPTRTSDVVVRRERRVETPGVVTVDVPFDVDVLVDGTAARHGSGTIDLPPGPHIVEIVNATLGVRIFRPVKVESGRTTALAIEPPQSTANFNALPWADVSLDGRALGQTPIGNVPVNVGEHEIVFSHPDLGTIRRVVTVTATAPLRVGVDLRSQR